MVAIQPHTTDTTLPVAVMSCLLQRILPITRYEIECGYVEGAYIDFAERRMLTKGTASTTRHCAMQVLFYLIMAVVTVLEVAVKC